MKEVKEVFGTFCFNGTDLRFLCMGHPTLKSAERCWDGGEADGTNKILIATATKADYAVFIGKTQFIKCMTPKQ